MSKSESTIRAEDALRAAYMHLNILERNTEGKDGSPERVLRWLAEAVNELIQVEKRRG